MAKRIKKPKTLPVPKADESKSEGNIYDRVFKEEAEDIFLPLVEKHMEIKIKKFSPLKHKLQRTVEREMDFFYKVETEDGKIFILHLEFQTENESDMIYRISEYHGIGLRRFKQKVKHLVIYLGTKPPTMRTQLEPDEIFTGFDLINLREIDSERFLASQIPQVILLAVLGKYPVEKTEQIVRSVVEKLRRVAQNPSELSRFFKQLIVISRLRKIEDLTTKITTDMPIVYDIETDYLFQQGVEKGEQRGIVQGIEQGIELSKQIFVVNLIENTDFEDAKIALLADVEEVFVRFKRKELFIKKLLTEATLSVEEIAQRAEVEVGFVENVVKRLETEE